MPTLPLSKTAPVLDTADLALAHGGGADVKQVASALFDILSKEGLQRIDPEGERFDPEHHEAVAHEPAEERAGPISPKLLRCCGRATSGRPRASTGHGESEG